MFSVEKCFAYQAKPAALVYSLTLDNSPEIQKMLGHIFYSKQIS